jgi:2,5-dioxopentanoate dehydrogenase
MSNINPVLILPAPLAARGGQIAASSVASLTLGAGQFCTNPGLILAPEGRALEDFVAKSVGERAYLEGRAG